MSRSLLSATLLSVCIIAQATEQLPTMIVTETGYPTALADALSSIDIISREDIENTAARDVADLLRFYGGMEIGRNGGPGQTTSLFIRGTESDQNLVLIDGIPIRSGSLGSSALQHIDPRSIERIEIVKGPQSTLWGSGAIGGVINIITRSGTTTGTHGSAALEGGGDNTWRGDGQLAFGQQQWQLNLGLSGHRTDGFSPRDDADQDRGYDNTSFTLAGNITAGKQLFSANHWQAQGNVEYLGFFLDPLDQDFLNSSSSLSWETDFNADWQSILTLSYVRDYIDQNQSREQVHTDRTELAWRNDITINTDQRLQLGIVGSHEKVKSRSGFSPYDEKTDYVEAYGQYDISLDDHHMIAGLRYLDHEDAGDRIIWSLNYGYHFTPVTRLTASAATGFRYPSANERYGFGGNPNLKPEESLSYELALRHQPAPGHALSASLFRNDIDNLIQFVIVVPPFTGFNQNVERARIDGVELEYDFNKGPWSLAVSATFQDPKDRDDDSRLLRRAYHTQSVRLGYDTDRWSLGTDVLLSGDRKDFGDITLDSYTLVNLNGNYQINSNWQLFAKVENLFDEQYELASGFNTQDRIGYLGIRYQR